MSTKKLAKELGLLRQRNQCASGTKKSLLTNQIFSYLIVIDFESTCWREKNNYSQEIIEFPAVLLDTSSGEVESEFHTYVQPQEHPTLSKFCMELTGITQMQVEAGIPLQICLSRFCRWLQNLQLEKGVIFPSKQESCSAPSSSQKLCTFVTWSDWDLGVCLKYECKRKQLHKPDVLNSWIDLRSTYRLFYSRKPKGLNGALQDLGIQFSGREHSGLDDARNTAKLAAKMMRDGCVMKITRRLEMPPPAVRPVSGNVTSDMKKESHNLKEENTHIINQLSASTFPPKSCQIQSYSVNFDTRESLVQESVKLHQSLISPKTLLNVIATPLWGHGKRLVTSEAVADLSSSVVTNNSSPQLNGNKSLVLCSTTLGCLSNLPQGNQLPEPGLRVQLVDEEESEKFVVETEERCGSYDDVVLEGDVMSNTEGECVAECVSDFNSGCYVGREPGKSRFTGGQVTYVSAGNNSKTSDPATSSVKMNRSNMAGQHSLIAGPDAHFVLPAVTWSSKTNWQNKVHKAFPQTLKRSNGNQKNITTNIPSPLRRKPFVPGQTSTPNILFAKPKVVTQNKKCKETPRSSFTIYADPARPTAASSHPSICSALDTSKKVLRSLSTNTHPSCNNSSSISVAVKKGQKITSPLCSCGRRAKRQVVSNGGPNHGRGFYCCPVRRSGGGGWIQKGCEFFKWESSLMKSSAAASVSLGQIDSTLNCRLQQRTTLRKSY